MTPPNLFNITSLFSTHYCVGNWLWATSQSNPALNCLNSDPLLGISCPAVWTMVLRHLGLQNFSTSEAQSDNPGRSLWPRRCNVGIERRPGKWSGCKAQGISSIDRSRKKLTGSRVIDRPALTTLANSSNGALIDAGNCAI